jgi:hypothetical protein
MLRVPSSTLSSRLRYSRFSQTLTAERFSLLPPTRIPFGMRAAVSEGRTAAGTDPLAAAGVAFLLFGETLFEGLHQLVPAELFELRALGVGQVFLHRLLQPLFGDQDVHSGQRFDALEVLAEGAIELVEVGLVLDQNGAREDVEVVETVLDDVLLQRFEQARNSLIDTGRRLALRCRKKSISIALGLVHSRTQRLWRAMKIRRSKR